VIFARYQPRSLNFLGVESVAEHQLKVYAIQYGDRLFDRRRFADGCELAAAALPSGSTDVCPGLGFMVLHQGATGDYLILCWWDRENELPTRVYVRGPEGWRPAFGGESFCVWDLSVMWWEREAYVASMLSGQTGGREAYLAMVAAGCA
jgi:hypothetical protein